MFKRINPDNLGETPIIPPNTKVGIYIKPSACNKVKCTTSSIETQTKLLALANRIGVKEEAIILYNESQGQTGARSEGVTALLDHIAADEIKAVIIPDHVFHDTAQVHAFIRICQEHSTLVITPSMTYDFTNQAHITHFLWQYETTALVRAYIISRLQIARAGNSSTGRYDGRSLAIGFIVDRRKHVDGEENPTYKKLLPYEPHAAIVRSIFSRYASIGNIKALYEELTALPIVFPAFDESSDPRNAAAIRLRQVPGGYHLSFASLVHLLTNVMYIGWWPHEQTSIKENHPALLEQELFWFAYNSLSQPTPDEEEHTGE